jgi:NAD(P)-dependent dehydrogenase (short-subunit alcohol dehydrogenase family)
LTIVSASEEALAGQTALVTGASTGIGRAVAIALARTGAKVGVVGRTEAELKALSERIGGWALPCDVTDAAALHRTTARFEELAGGPPDLVVASAGVFSLAPAESLTVEELDRHLDVNLRGAILTVREVLPGLLRTGRGTLILVGSVGGRRGLRGNAAYAASKFGLRGFHEVLLTELKGSGVRTTLLEPAATDTPIWDPLDPDRDPKLPNRGDMLRPEDVAETVIFVATRPSGVQIPYLPIERA